MELSPKNANTVLSEAEGWLGILEHKLRRGEEVRTRVQAGQIKQFNSEFQTCGEPVKVATEADA
jgi:hypothetical protein